MSGALGIIAGTGFPALEALADAHEQRLDTVHGPARVVVGTWHGRITVFCPRHGADHSIPPHRVNYRANVRALAALGVTEILAVNAVGGIGHAQGDLVVVDDFLDYTRTRVSTFFDGTTPEGVVHVDMTEPYDARLRGVWLDAAAALGVDVTPTGVYACFDGPRFETRAEIRMAGAAGATVVGMTGVPEVVLAREQGLPYASLCIVTNPAAGQGETPISIDQIQAVLESGARTVTALLDEAARQLARGR